MVDTSKLFDVLRNKPDADAKAELILAMQDASEHHALRTTGYKISQSATGSSFGYSVSQNDADIKDSSLFQVAVARNKLHSASILLQTLGVEALAKANDLNENGFHAVAKCDNQDFKTWFFTESVAATSTQLSAQYRDAVNAITTTDQHVFTLINRLTLEEIKYWVKLGADPQCTGMKSGTLLHYLCEKQKSDLVKAVAQAYPQLLAARNDKGQIPIHLAAHHDASECFRILMEAGSSVAVEDKKFHRPLHTAIVKGSVLVIQLILQQQFSLYMGGKYVPYVNVPTGVFDMPLHLLIAHAKSYTEAKFQETFNLFITYGADTSLTNAKNQTPIRLARDLLDDSKLSVNNFAYVWNKIVEKLPLHFFSQETLILKIYTVYPVHIAQQLITQLLPVFQAAGPNVEPIQYVQQRYVESLKQQVQITYPNNPQVAQPFSIILDEVAKAHQATQTERTHTTAMLSFMQQAANQQTQGNPNAPSGNSSTLYMNTQ